jgi:hypothetical protein
MTGPARPCHRPRHKLARISSAVGKRPSCFLEKMRRSPAQTSKTPPRPGTNVQLATRGSMTLNTLSVNLTARGR